MFTVNALEAAAHRAPTRGEHGPDDVVRSAVRPPNRPGDMP